VRHACANGKIRAHKNVLKKTRAGAADNALMSRYDVHNYHIDLEVENNSTVVAGSGTIGLKLVEPSDTICYELNGQLNIDSVLVNGVSVNFVHLTNDIVYAILPGAMPAGINLSVQTFYAGDASVTGGAAIGDGFSTDSSPTWGNSVTWSLSEPYSSKEWFPVKQFLQDKADSCSVYVTTSNSNKVGSQGILMGTDNLPNNKVRYRWKSNYVIDYYLISVAVAQYVDYTTYAYPAALVNDSIAIVNYVYNNPNTLNNFKSRIDSTAMLVEYFSEKLGLYPFHTEKYGHAMAPFSGGMEHQTMSSMGFFNFGLIAHELMHQWFGDYVTCATWSDIFINEGFASYGQYMAYEEFRSLQAAQDFMEDVHDDVMDQPGGSIYFTDTTNVGRIFSGRLSYDKGNAVIHSLRFELGDSIFYQSLRNFLAAKAFGTSDILDFQTSVEATSGKNLQDFFSQWVFGEGYPEFDGLFWTDGAQMFLRVTQSASTTTTPLFKTPLEIKCFYSGGDTTIKIQLDQLVQGYVLPMTHNITNIQFDPNNWILNKQGSIVRNASAIAVGTQDIGERVAIRVYPNPTTDLIFIENKTGQEAAFSLYSNEGKLLQSWQSRTPVEQLDFSSYASGTYQIQVELGDEMFNEKILKR